MGVMVQHTQRIYCFFLAVVRGQKRVRVLSLVHSSLTNHPHKHLVPRAHPVVSDAIGSSSTLL